MLAGNKKGFGKLAFAAKDELREALEPSAVRNFRIEREPIGHMSQVLCMDPTLPRARKQVTHDCLSDA